MNKRQQQKQETKKKILKAAYKVYSKIGFSATTKDISEEVNMSHGTIFLHFPTKDDLIICILENFGNEVTTLLHALVEESKSISDILKAHLSVIEKHEDFYNKLISENKLLPLETQNILITIQSSISFHLNKVIEKEKSNYTIKDLPNYFIFNTWIGLIHHYIQNKNLFSPNSSVIKRYSDELIKNFLELIKN